MDSEIAAVSRCAPDKPAQHVLAIGISRSDPLRDQEGDSARMIGNRPIRYVAFRIFAVRMPITYLFYDSLNSFDDRLEKIDIVIAK